MKKSNPKQRSIQWFARQDIYGFIYRSWMKNRGVPHDMFDGRPVIGICNTWSELTPCNTHFRVLAEHVRHGVLDAGGFPLEFPVMSLGETLMRPTAMLYRNLASMDVEESIRANPLDGVVLLAGCDKTTPATLMGACSVDLPAILVSGGPMLSGKYHGKDIGSGTNTWSMSEDLRAGKITLEEFHEAESCMHRSHGHCMTMGTASTMASMIEALGVGMPGNAAIPAVDARRYVLARMAGRRIVELVKQKISVSRILTREAFENAIRALAAIGGSTNAVIHLTAIARRIGVDLDLDDFDRLGRGVHTLVNLMPSGQYLMEDFYYAGGLPAVLRELGENNLLHRDALTVNGKTIWENNQDAPRPRGGVREHRGLPPPHRRPQARHRRELHDGAQELRPQGLPRHGRGRQHAAAAQAAEERRHRHGAHLGRAHERDRLRHRGAARLPGSCGRRRARAGRERRHDRAGRRIAQAVAAGGGRRSAH